jgi:hypothetical protein
VALVGPHLKAEASHDGSVNQPRSQTMNRNGGRRQDEVQSILPTFLSRASNTDKKTKPVIVRALVDGGAQASFVTSWVAKQLGLKVQPSRVAVSTLGGDSTTKVEGSTTLRLASLVHPFEVEIQVLVMPRLVDRVQSLKFHPFQRYRSMKKLRLPTADVFPWPEGAEIQVLIGQNFLWHFMAGKTHWPKEGTEAGPVFVASPMGLIVQGAITPADVPAAGRLVAAVGPERTSISVPKALDVAAKEREPKLETLLQRLWNLDSIGITVPKEDKLTAKEQFAVEFLEENMVFDEKNKRFVVKLPFNPKLEVMSNEKQARARFENLWNSLLRNPERMRLYKAEMQRYFDEGHAVKLTKEDYDADKVFYLPHRDVVTTKADGSLKARIIFDCSARDHLGTSLNDTMQVGPVPNSNLGRILSAWRFAPCCVQADVKQCFLNIELHRSQQNLFRFFWRVNDEVTPSTFLFKSLIFGSAASPWVSATCIRRTLERYRDEEPELVDKLARALWVDDAVLGIDSVEEGRRTIAKMEEMFASSSFSLGKYVAEPPEMLDGLKEEQKVFQGRRREPVKVLGILWHEDDTIGVAGDYVKAFQGKAGEETKRTIAKKVASIFDPLGLVQPYKVAGLLILQKVWALHQEQAEREQINKGAKKLWDQKVPAEIQEQVQKWAAGHEKAMDIKAPRCLRSTLEAAKDISVFGMADASPHAYGCLVYLRVTYDKREPSVVLVASKGRVAPTEKHSLPRLELLAAKMLSRMIVHVYEWLQLPTDVPYFCFSDSTITLHWISRSPEDFRPYVHNQLVSIQANTEKDRWYHCESALNAADVLTRPLTMEEFWQVREFYLYGPGFVKDGRIPEQPGPLQGIKEDELERRKEAGEVVACAAMAGVQASAANFVDPFSEYSRYEDWYRTTRVIATVKRAIVRWDILRTKRTGKPRLTSGEDRRGRIFYDWSEKQEVYTEIARIIQHQAFASLIADLAKGKTVVSDKSLRELRPYLDEKGLLRAKGRSSPNSDHLPFNYRFPLIMPNHSEMMERFVKHVHRQHNHAGVDWLHAEFRSFMWILKARQTLKKFKSRCMVCRRYDSPEFAPIMAPLPSERTAVSVPVFTHIAIDGLGPLMVVDGRKEKKVWLLVMTCLTYRAVFIEILDDLSTEAFASALRLEIAQFGTPRTIRLDNFSSHVKLSHQVKDLEAAEAIEGMKNHLSEQGIRWSFACVKNPSSQGVIERMVRLVKDCLKKTLHRQKVTRQQLHVLIKEAQSTCNNRPLTQIAQSSTEDQMAICPQHFILGRRLDALPFAADLKLDHRKPLWKVWEDRQALHKTFNQIFIDGYLSELRRLKKWQKEEPSIQIGDLVLNAEPSAKRRDWPLCVVDGLVGNTKDSTIRTVRLRMADKYVTRSVRTLIFLRSLPDYEPAGEAAGEAYGGDQHDPERDAKMRFTKNPIAPAVHQEIDKGEVVVAPGLVLRPRRQAGVTRQAGTSVPRQEIRGHES